MIKKHATQPEMKTRRATIREWMSIPGVEREQVTEQIMKKFQIERWRASSLIAELNETMDIFPKRITKAKMPPASKVGYRICARCEKEKPNEDFPIKKRRQEKIEQYAYCKDCHKIYAKTLYLKSAFNLTPEERDSLGNKCMICGFVPKEGKNQVAVDHDHKTGLIRGRLCSRCNRGLTWFQDKPEIFLSAYNYLTCPPAIEILGEKRYGRIGTATGKRKKFKKHASLFNIVEEKKSK